MAFRPLNGNRQILQSKYDDIHYVHTVRKWPVQTGALLGAGLLSGLELLWRGFMVNWEMFSDRAQELFTLEILLPGIVIGGACGAMICLIRNQRKGAKDEDE